MIPTPTGAAKVPVRSAAEITLESVNRACHIVADEAEESGWIQTTSAVAFARHVAVLAVDLALAEQQKDFNAQLEALRAECEPKRRAWREDKEQQYHP